MEVNKMLHVIIDLLDRIIEILENMQPSDGE